MDLASDYSLLCFSGPAILVPRGDFGEEFSLCAGVRHGCRPYVHPDRAHDNFGVQSEHHGGVKWHGGQLGGRGAQSKHRAVLLLHSDGTGPLLRHSRVRYRLRERPLPNNQGAAVLFYPVDHGSNVHPLELGDSCSTSINFLI